MCNCALCVLMFVSVVVCVMCLSVLHCIIVVACMLFFTLCVLSCCFVVSYESYVCCRFVFVFFLLLDYDVVCFVCIPSLLASSCVCLCCLCSLRVLVYVLMCLHVCSLCD